MTDQIDDLVRFEGADLDLAEHDGELDRFVPAAHGLTPVFAGTDCWDGYHLGYVVEDWLYLDRVDIAVSPEAGGEAPIMFGHVPSRRTTTGPTWLTYRGLQQRCDFTGSFLLGRGNTGAPLTPRGYCYASVVELAFEAGRLVNASDATAEMCRLRTRWEDRPRLSADVPDLEFFARAREQSKAYSGFFGSRRALSNPV